MAINVPFQLVQIVIIFYILVHIRNSPRNSLDITFAFPDSDLLIEINLGEIDILLINVFFFNRELFISPKQDIYDLSLIHI